MATAIEIGDALYRARRLRAYRGQAEAEAYSLAMLTSAAELESATQSMGSEASAGNAVTPVAGLSQAELDSLSESVVDAPDKAQPPDELCFLLKRTRAFRGVGAAEALASELMALKGNLAATTSLQPPAEQHISPGPPQQQAAAKKTLSLPVARSPTKEGSLRDPLDLVASPSRRRRCGPISPKCGGA